MWQSIRCDILTANSGGSAMEFIGPRLRAHAMFVAQRILKTLSKSELAKQKIKALAKVEEWDELNDAAFGELLLKVFEKFEILQGVPFVAYGIDKGLALFREIRKRTDFKSQLAQGGEVKADLARAETIFKALIGMAHPKAPLILALEDMHLLDDEMAGLVAALSVFDPKRPVMVIGTSWPESSERETYRALMDLLSQADIKEPPRLLHVGSASGTLAFPRLSVADRGKFVKEYAPKTSPAMATKVAKAYENPFAIKLAMSSGGMQRRIKGGKLHITDRDLRNNPKNIEDIYRARWQELPKSVKQLLTAAVSLTPHLESSQGRLFFFLKEPFQEAIDIQRQIHGWTWGFDETLESALGRHSWLYTLPDSNGLDYQFKEWFMQEIARSHLIDSWSEDEIFSFRNTCARQLGLSLVNTVSKNESETAEIMNWRDTRTQRACRFLLALQALGGLNELPAKAIRISELTLGDEAREHQRFNKVLAYFKPEYFPLDTKFGIWGRATRLWVLSILQPSLKALREADVLCSKTHLHDVESGVYWNLLLSKERILRGLCMDEDALTLMRQTLPKVRHIHGKLGDFTLSWEFAIARNLANMHMYKQCANAIVRCERLLSASKMSDKEWFLEEIHRLKWRIRPGKETAGEVQIDLDKKMPISSMHDYSPNDVINHAESMLGPVRAYDYATSVAELRILISRAEEIGDEAEELRGRLLSNLAQALYRYHSLSVDDSFKDDLRRVSEQAFMSISSKQANETRSYFYALLSRADQLNLIGDYDQAENCLNELQKLSNLHRNRQVTKLDYLWAKTYTSFVKAAQHRDPKDIASYRKSVEEIIDFKRKYGFNSSGNARELMRLFEMEKNWTLLLKIAKKAVTDNSVNDDPDSYSDYLYFYSVASVHKGKFSHASHQLFNSAVEITQSSTIAAFRKIEVLYKLILQLQELYFPLLTSQIADLLLGQEQSLGELTDSFRRNVLRLAGDVYWDIADFDRYISTYNLFLEYESSNKADTSNPHVLFALMQLEYAAQLRLPSSARNPRRMEKLTEAAVKYFGSDDGLAISGSISSLEFQPEERFVSQIEMYLSTVAGAAPLASGIRARAQFLQSKFLLQSDPKSALILLKGINGSLMAGTDSDTTVDAGELLLAYLQGLLNLNEFLEVERSCVLLLEYATQSQYPNWKLLIAYVELKIELNLKIRKYLAAEELCRQMISSMDERFGKYHLYSLRVHVFLARAYIGARMRDEYVQTMRIIRRKFNPDYFTDDYIQEISNELAKHKSSPWA
jgi:hypothetical protein